MGYIEVPVDVEPVDFAEEAFAYIEGKVPGWLPSPGNLEAWLVEANAQMAAELRDVEALVPDSIFGYLGRSILGIPPFLAVSATGYTTWTAIDAAGYTVDAGTLIALSPPASTEAYAFEVVSDFTIAAGNTAFTDVLVRAIEAGAAASGLTGDVEMIDPLDFIATVTLQAATSGGVDAEASDAYLDRLSDLLTLLAPRPILPQDFAVMTQRNFPQVARAVAIDLYNASTAQSNVPRCVTVVAVDADGQPLPADVKTQIDDFLQARREVNFLVFVADPTYTTIDVTVRVMAYPGWDPTDVADRVKADLTTYLSPAGWGLPPFGDASARSWINDTSVRYLEVAEVVNKTDGVHYIETLSIGKSGQAQAQADIALTGVAPMPKPGNIAAQADIEP